VIYIGVDPGQNGAIGILDGQYVRAVDVNGSLPDAFYWLKEYKSTESSDWVRASAGCIEKVSSMPGQGVASSFKFGCTYGHLRGFLIALGVPIKAEPTPRTWKQAIFGASIFGRPKAEQKTMARDMARQLWPEYAHLFNRVKDADRAEACLLAEYLRRLERGQK
jgi:hypothetical protein